MRGGEGDLFLGRCFPDNSFWVMGSAAAVSVSFYLDLDHYSLGQIERIREGKDVQLTVIPRLIVEIQGQLNTRQSLQTSFGHRLPKSDWVEKILSQIGYKDAYLFEIPKLPNGQFQEVSNNLNSAWRQFMMGEYDKVLTDCRKTLEALATQVRTRGFEKDLADDKGKRPVPDWKKFLGNEDLGDIIGNIYQKAYGFTTPGAHAGRSINREDADMSLMVTHGIVQFVVRKLIDQS